MLRPREWPSTYAATSVCHLALTSAPDLASNVRPPLPLASSADGCHFRRQAFDELLEDNGASRPKDASVTTLPIEWVVDIADTGGDWFVATAYSYNGEPQVSHADCRR